MKTGGLANAPRRSGTVGRVLTIIAIAIIVLWMRRTPLPRCKVSRSKMQCKKYGRI